MITPAWSGQSSDSTYICMYYLSLGKNPFCFGIKRLKANVTGNSVGINKFKLYLTNLPSITQKESLNSSSKGQDHVQVKSDNTV